MCSVLILESDREGGFQERQKRRRGSLPAAASGTFWTSKTLTNLGIEIVYASTSEWLSVFGVQPSAFTPSTVVASLVDACSIITPEALIEPFVLPRESSDSSSPSSYFSSAAFKLYMYLRLINSQPRPESVVDDFVIHLLDALGFNDGPLLVLSKNNLKLQMNNNSESAITDVTIYHFTDGLRVAVFEDKRDADPQLDLESIEAQLVAAAIASVQANMQREYFKPKRTKSGDARIVVYEIIFCRLHFHDPCHWQQLQLLLCRI